MPEEQFRHEMMLGAFEEAVEDEGFSPPGYEVLEEIDRGGMAVVYLARQKRPEREVAMKVTLPRFSGEKDVGARFQQEARAMATLDHPGVLPIYEVGEWDGMSFLTMKLAAGGTLAERLKKGLPDEREAAEWLVKVGEAVHFAHQRGVLHRDLKPANLLFDAGGKIYVGDFGVAKLDGANDGNLTRTEALVGTPNYLAPEVASGEMGSGSVSSDLYGLGAVLYECLTGRRPHDDAENLAAQLRQIVEGKILPIRKVRPEVSKDLAVICEKALATVPEERYRSAEHFVADLKRWLGGLTILARPASPLEIAAKWSRRHPLPTFLAILSVISIIGAAIGFAKAFQRRGELLQEGFVNQARTLRILGTPGFRERAVGYLQSARKIGYMPVIKDEAVAALSRWDVVEGADMWEPRLEDDQYLLEEGATENHFVERATGDDYWSIGGGVWRCPPAWSSDGRFMAVSKGDRMGVTIYDVPSKKVFAALALRAWPESLAFRPEGQELALRFADGSVSYVTAGGEWLIENAPGTMVLSQPVGFRQWSGQALAQGEAVSYHGAVSPDERWLVTTSALGLQVWSLTERHSVAYHPVGNQRIDALTDAWWLSATELLVQIPGGLERMMVSDEGEILEVEKLSRVPGTKVVEVFPTGEWLMSVLDEDGVKSLEIWPKGNSEEARMPETHEVIERESASEARVIRHLDWVLPLPQGEVLSDYFVVDQDRRVVALTRDYRIYEWDLEALDGALKSKNLDD